MRIFDISNFTGRAQTLLITASLTAVLTGCPTVAPPPTAQSLMQQSDVAMGSGQADAAADYLNQAAKTDPSNKEVWVKLARVQFERHDYPKAITAATEALARVPDSQEARSVMFVSSMRLAVNSLNDIRKDTPLTDDRKVEAELLVKSLRETLGESVLVPTLSDPNKDKVKARPVSHTTKPDTSAATASAAKSKPAAAPAKPAEQASGSDDPFGTLR